MDDLELEAKRNGRKEAFACIGSHDPRMGHLQPGLTKRELFAAMAMQGLLSNVDHDILAMNAEQVGQVALNVVDTLLEQLEMPASKQAKPSEPVNG